MARTRQRVRGRRGGEVEHFAKIPVSVLESEACRTLSHAAFRVLVCLASGYSGRNNGALAMTPRFAGRFGFNSRDTLYRALHELMERGLIVQTRQGMKMKNVFALFALGWEDIHILDGKPLDMPQTRNNLRWLNWRASVPAIGTDKKKIETDHRTQPVPMTGTDSAECVPTIGNRSPICVPTIGNTLRSRPQARTRAAGSGSGLHSEIERLLLELPHLQNGDVAKMLDTDSMTVAEVRQSIELDAREINL